MWKCHGCCGCKVYSVQVDFKKETLYFLNFFLTLQSDNVSVACLFCLIRLQKNVLCFVYSVLDRHNPESGSPVDGSAIKITILLLMRINM